MKLNGFHILFADDRRESRYLVDHLLRDAGATVVCVENGQEALEAILDPSLDREQFDVVILDISMPVIDGIEVVQQMRLKEIDLPALAVSCADMEHDRIECLSAGFDDFLSKPIVGEVLIRKVSHLARTRRVPNLHS